MHEKSLPSAGETAEEKPAFLPTGEEQVVPRLSSAAPELELALVSGLIQPTIAF